MKIYVVRHGETSWNANHKIQGQSNVPLDEKGKKQAEELAKKIEKLEYDKIISSPLQRALDTAKAINKKNKPIEINANIVERGYGDLEGAQKGTYDRNEFLEFWDYEKNKKGKNVEPIQEFIKRIQTEVEKIIKENEGKDVLLVTHNGVNIGIYTYFNGIPKDLLAIQIENCNYEIYETEK